MFTANIASSVDNQGRGGGMNNEGSNPIVTGCIFTGNTSQVDGGGLRNAASSPMVTDCTFIGNESGGGAGMFNWAGSNPTVVGCTFDANMATVNGGGMLNANDSMVQSLNLKPKRTKKLAPTAAHKNSRMSVTFEITFRRTLDRLRLGYGFTKMKT